MRNLKKQEAENFEEKTLKCGKDIRILLEPDTRIATIRWRRQFFQWDQ